MAKEIGCRFAIKWPLPGFPDPILTWRRVRGQEVPKGPAVWTNQPLWGHAVRVMGHSGGLQCPPPPRLRSVCSIFSRPSHHLPASLEGWPAPKRPGHTLKRPCGGEKQAFMGVLV